MQHNHIEKSDPLFYGRYNHIKILIEQENLIPEDLERYFEFIMNGFSKDKLLNKELALIFNFLATNQELIVKCWSEFTDKSALPKLMGLLRAQTISYVRWFDVQDLAAALNFLTATGNANKPAWQDFSKELGIRILNILQFATNELTLKITQRILGFIGALAHPEEFPWQPLRVLVEQKNEEFYQERNSYQQRSFYQERNSDQERDAYQEKKTYQERNKAQLAIVNQNLYKIYNNIKNNSHPSPQDFEELCRVACKEVINLNSIEISLVLNLCSKHLPLLNGIDAFKYMRIGFSRKILIAIDTFDGHSLALVFNFLSKLDDVNDLFWRRLLIALRDRSLKVVHTFNSGLSLGLAFKFITTLDNRNEPFWQELIIALREQACELVHTFNPLALRFLFTFFSEMDNLKDDLSWQRLIALLRNRACAIADTFDEEDVAAVYEFIIQSGNINNPDWKDLLNALKLPIINSWEKTFIQKSKLPNNFVADGFFEKFIQYEFSVEELETLGNVNLYNSAHYFNSSEESENQAKNFLNSFFSFEENVQATISSHQKKYEFITKESGIESTNPSCLSFVSAEIGSDNYCFIVSSIYRGDSIVKKIKEHAEQSNALQDQVKFITIMNDEDNDFSAFSKLIAAFQRKESSRNCAEKKYTKFLFDLFAKYGSNLQIKGVSNCLFYPYQKNAVYGLRENSIDFRIKPQRFSPTAFQVGSDYVTDFIACCPECMKRKPLAMCLLKSGQFYGDELQKNNKSSVEAVNSIIEESSKDINREVDKSKDINQEEEKQPSNLSPEEEKPNVVEFISLANNSFTQYGASKKSSVPGDDGYLRDEWFLTAMCSIQ